MKKITAGLAAAAAIVTPLVVAAPAHANYSQFSCTYQNGAAHINGADLTVTDGPKLPGDPTGENRMAFVLDFNDGSGRNWDWKVMIDGAVRHSGNATGSFRVDRTMLDFAGPDNVKAVVESGNGNVRCVATTTWTS